MWLDLTADGDVFVPDRRFGRSRRLIDGSLLLSHTLLPIRLAPTFARLSSPAVSSHLVSSRLPPLVSSRFALLASSCYQHLVLLCPVLRPLLSFFLLPPLPPTPVTQSCGSEKALRAPPSSFVFLPGRL